MIVDATTAQYCYLDIDVDSYRMRYAHGAAFVHATSIRYGLSSNDVRKLGGSELPRCIDYYRQDYEWSNNNNSNGSTTVGNREAVFRPPSCGNRIVVQLFWDVAPLACQNFATLCRNGSSTQGLNKKNETSCIPPIGTSGKPMTYKDCVVHRIVPGFIFQSGDYVMNNGSGGESIFGGGKKFKDEKEGLKLQHDRRGVLSMGNSGKNSNSSQFFITFAPVPICDGKHVIFGKVISGWSTLDAIEEVGTKDGTPQVPVIITDAGLWTHTQCPGAGYWFDRPDPTAYEGTVPVFIVRPRVLVLVPSNAVAIKFTQQIEFLSTCVVTCQTVPADVKCIGYANAITQVVELLNNAGIDVILIAPSCAESILSDFAIDLPSKVWGLIPRNEVIIVTKPVDAIDTVRTRSWIGLQKSPSEWPLDGV
jgi:peptidylprolyl isomerase